ncbi:alkaline phosphatase family protein [Amnibacterium sp. CER49]|uniref:alkaline phosphatase family protein n=1 Tax=Amnibacterium sp. CER49 TaxID=3039161 RepID=UPI00244A5C35|nr:alkaline phosphatase family protein [Amnibacterium sp. CER49]MDH2444907.1 alkaline phosphatase family protein [Amnibacterium sp. CER49]
MTAPLRRRIARRSVLTTMGVAAVAAALVGCAPSAAAPARTSAAVAKPSAAPVSTLAPRTSPVPRPAHVVIVIEENKAYDEVASQSFLARAAKLGVTFTDFRATRHPSEPNYVAMWSGSTHGIDSDACPVDLGSAPSFGSQLLDAGRSVAIYSEDLPNPGYLGCTAGAYARKHNPLADFSATAGAAHNLPFSAFPTDYATLPDVAVVVPNLDDDMHDGSVSAGNAWLEQHLSGYLDWARTHDSLLVTTFDEDDKTANNRIYTSIVGQRVQPGTDGTPMTHYRLLHTLEAAFGLPPLGEPGAVVTGIWR